MKSVPAQNLVANVGRRPSAAWAAFERELRNVFAAMPINVFIAAIREAFLKARQESSANADAARYRGGCNIH